MNHPFWAEPHTDQAADAKAKVKLIVETPNKGYWW
jgi:hypothetical protein